MVIFSHGIAAKDKGEEVRGGIIHKGISHGRRRFTTNRVPWIRSLERKLQWRKRMRERRGKLGVLADPHDKDKPFLLLPPNGWVEMGFYM